MPGYRGWTDSFWSEMLYAQDLLPLVDTPQKGKQRGRQHESFSCLNSSHLWRTHSKAFAIISDSDPESSPLSFRSSYYGGGVKVHPIRLPHIVKRSISNRSFLVVLCLSSVDCGVPLLLSSGLGGESGGGSLVTSVTGGGAGGKGLALGLGCLVMEVEARCTLGSAKKKQSKRATWFNIDNSLSTKIWVTWETE